MLPYESFFYGCMFFFAGIILASFGIAPLYVLLLTAVIGGYFLFLRISQHSEKPIWTALLTIFIILGSLYYAIVNQQFHATKITEGNTVIHGVVTQDLVQNGERFQFVARQSEYPNISYLVYAQNKYDASYGDLVEIRGVVRETTGDGFGRYLEAKGIRATVLSKSIRILGHNAAPRYMSVLHAIHEFLTDSFIHTMDPEKGSFLAGITLGARNEISDELKEAMKYSGTTHIVALSGYNISIIVVVLMGGLSHLMSKRTSFLITLSVIFAFVIMTGAEASVVRAAILGAIFLFAENIGKQSSVRNVITFTGLLMVLGNPKLVVFDVGFQLSFLALLGIVYVEPMLRALMVREKRNEKEPFWITAALTTAAAQIATIPILVSSFGYFSPVSFISNILVLELIPVTMAFGFLVAGMSVVYYASFAFAQIASVLVTIELFLIRLFAHLSIPLSIHMSVFWFVMYYVLLIVLVIRVNKIPHSVRD